VTDFEVFNQGNGEQDIDEWVRLNGEQDMWDSWRSCCQ
jgi:hypothetical protein